MHVQQMYIGGFIGQLRSRIISFFIKREAKLPPIKKNNSYNDMPPYQKKSPAMFLVFGAIYSIFIAGLGSRLWMVLSAYSELFELVVLAFFFLVLLVFAGMAAYFISVTLFGIISSDPSPPIGYNWIDSSAPAVALLYTVCNDFQESAALTAVQQHYPNFHVFLLDDSWAESSKNAVDAFHKSNSQNTTLIRRKYRHGFKAGNLNDCLNGAASKFPYFVVLDADERLPPEFLERTVPYLESSDLAFVQANHAPSPFQTSSFAFDLGPTLLPFWDVHCRPRNSYGLVMYVGHGALIRKSDWDVVGGFSDVALEDFAFTGDLALKGKRGLFLASLLCYEDFPDSYLKFKRQYERFIAGALEISSRLSWRILTRSSLTMVERLDFCLWIVPLFVPLLSLSYTLITVFGVCGIIGDWHRPTLVLGGSEFLLLPGRIVEDSRFAPLWDWQFIFLSLILSLSPAAACIVLGIKKKLNAVKILTYSYVAYMSVMVVSLRGFVRYFVTGKTLGGFTSGGGKLEVQNEGAAKLGDVSVGSMNSKWKPPSVAEFVLGTAILIGGLVCFNLSLASVGFCLLIGLCIERFGWDSRKVKISVIVCFLCVPFQILISLVFNRHIPGLPPMIFSLHL